MASFMALFMALACQ